MKILRNKSFSETNKKSETPKKVGEALGTALIGTAGTIGAADLVERGSKKVFAKSEGIKAKKDFKEGIKNLDATRKANNFNAEVARGSTDSGNALDLIFHKRNVRRADQKYKAAVKENEKAFKTGVKTLKDKVISQRNNNITRKSGKLGKAALGIGLAATGVAAGMKLRKKNKE